MIYEPQEDSLLLKKWVEKYAFGDALDMGAGSGILSLAALDNCDSVLAVDIDDESLEHLRRLENTHPGLRVKRSDLFENLDNEKFDTIIFNPPYLPYEPKEDKETARMVSGGTKEHPNPYYIIERFFKQVSKHLNENGIILMVFSSLTNKRVVDRIIQEAGFTHKLLETKKLAFEELYVYLIQRTQIG